MPEPASTDRLLNLRLRADLAFAEVPTAGAPTWTVKDPLTLEHHQFTAEEYFLLEQMRRPTSLAQLRRRFERMFAPQRITYEAIWSFLNRGQESGLLVSQAPGQGQRLLQRGQEERTRQWSMAWTQLLAIRLPGVDPDRWLTAVDRRCRWLFSWPIAVLALATMLFALSLVVGHFDQFRAQLPELTALADVRNVFSMMAALAVVKVLHELGHALVCKRFGGEVHELGLMLLAFTPCLYCDVSDAWQMASKRKRILISAAGILVELWLASLAVIVWWYSQPGILNLLALNIVLICTVSTLLVNGNPLLRYDGYYILSDLVESPNLWQRSRQVLGELGRRWLLGLESTADAITPASHRRPLAAYALASKLYLACVLVGIVWMLVQLLYPLHLQNVAYGIGMLVVGSTLVGPVKNAHKLLGNPLRRRQLRSGRLTLIATAAVLGSVLLLRAPVPYPVTAPLVLMPEDAERVHATVDGQLTHAAKLGDFVQPGDEVLRLDNAEIERELAQLEGRRKLQELRLEHLYALRTHDRQASAEIPAGRAALASVEQQLADRRRDAQRLRITARRAGTVLPVPAVQEPGEPTGRLDYWTGSLLDEMNHGALVPAGTLVCWIGDPQRLEAVALVDDNEAPRIEVGQPVRVELDSLPGEVVRGEVREIARRDTSASHLEGAADPPLDRLTEDLVPAGRESIYYHVRVTIEAAATPLVAGSRGRAKIATRPMTLGRRAFRWLAQTFRVPIH